MTQHDERSLDQCAAYAIGALDGDELKEFESHIAGGCAICRQELDVLIETACLLPAALPEVRVPQELKDRIMFSVKLAKVAKSDVEERTKKLVQQLPIAEQPIRRRRVGIPWLAVGLTLGAILLVIATAAFINSLFSTITRQQEFLSSQQTQIESLADQLENRNTLLKILEERNLTLLELHAQPAASQAAGKLVLSPDGKKMLLQASGLPLSPPDRSYQLWLVKDNRPISAMLFPVSNERDRENFFRVQLIDVGDPRMIRDAFITLEPASGSAQPSGESYLLAEPASASGKR